MIFYKICQFWPIFLTHWSFSTGSSSPFGLFYWTVITVWSLLTDPLDSMVIFRPAFGLDDILDRPIWTVRHFWPTVLTLWPFSTGYFNDGLTIFDLMVIFDEMFKLWSGPKYESNITNFQIFEDALSIEYNFIVPVALISRCFMTMIWSSVFQTSVLLHTKTFFGRDWPLSLYYGCPQNLTKNFYFEIFRFFL